MTAPAATDITESAVGAVAVEAFKKLSLAEKQAKEEMKTKRQQEKHVAEMIAATGPSETPTCDIWP